ncbi:uncharacterized protein LOC142579554 isoform X2 [Dermacentor variabilis]|uniref:uncharacterized protein LOC142579554 isoform X2 n=1 Tax=Dermacentor variabilis TaxID=34621 RepID=UPI003F5C7FD3
MRGAQHKGSSHSSSLTTAEDDKSQQGLFHHCDFCDYETKSLFDLKKHNRVHTDNTCTVASTLYLSVKLYWLLTLKAYFWFSSRIFHRAGLDPSSSSSAAVCFMSTAGRRLTDQIKKLIDKGFLTGSAFIGLTQDQGFLSLQQLSRMRSLSSHASTVVTSVTMKLEGSSICKHTSGSIQGSVPFNAICALRASH